MERTLFSPYGPVTGRCVAPPPLRGADPACLEEPMWYFLGYEPRSRHRRLDDRPHHPVSLKRSATESRRTLSAVDEASMGR